MKAERAQRRAQNNANSAQEEADARIARQASIGMTVSEFATSLRQASPHVVMEELSRAGVEKRPDERISEAEKVTCHRTRRALSRDLTLP